MSESMGNPTNMSHQWKHSVETLGRNSEADRAHSQKLTAECKRLIDESNKSIDHMQQYTKRRLEERLQDIRFWRQELQQRFEEMVEEIETLCILKARVEKALENCSDPLGVAMQCLAKRPKRVAISLAQDEVEEELLKEKEVIEGVMLLLQRTLEQINEQIRLLHSMKYSLEKDLNNKFQAEYIDDTCSLLTNSSPGVDCLDFGSIGSVLTPDEWETFCNMNLSKAEKEKNHSASLRALVESLLEQTTTDMKRQYESTTHALLLHIQDTKLAKANLEDQLDQLLEEISNQEKNLTALRVAVAEKEAPLRVAQTRLSARGQRPYVELCHDPAQIQLQIEVNRIFEHIKSLTKAVELSEMELKSLTRNQRVLEEEIQAKSNSLFTDEVICLQLRQSVGIHPV